MSIMDRYLVAIIINVVLMSSIQPVFGVPYKDAPELEPFLLTQALIEELTQPAADSSSEPGFRLEGITVTAGKVRGNSITLSAEVDPRLNLWRGRPNDLASSHLGSMELIITSITDENGNNIHDTSRDKPWSNKVVIYNLGEGVFQGSRSANFKTSPGDVNIRQVKGDIKLSLPINQEEYVILADEPESTETLLDRDAISEVKLKNGIYLKHPDSRPDFRLTIMGFNSYGERISIASTGSAGSKQENHWYYFSTKDKFEKMLIFIPEEFISVEIPFIIDLTPDN